MIRLTIKWVAALALLAATKANAQEFQGIAYYESKTSLSGDFKIEGNGMTEEMRRTMEERMKKALEKKYTLTFNKTESLYEEEQQLEAPKANNGMVIKMQTSTDGKVYKDLKKKVAISEEDFFGKEFLVTDSLATYNWKLEADTKKIGDYTCYKATHLVKATEEEKAEYEDFKKKKQDGKTQFFMSSEPKDQLITVWYTPEIPVSHGPAEYWGLPGLILEANFDRTTLLCSKIVVNPKDKVTIKIPKNGKKVTKKEYERLITQQMEQMKDGDGNIKIEIRQ